MELRVPMAALPLLRAEEVAISKGPPPAAHALRGGRRWVSGRAPRVELALPMRRASARFWFEAGRLKIGFYR